MTRWITLVLAPVSAGLVVGCSSVPKSAGFDDVRAQLAKRNVQGVQWNQGSAADQEVAQATRSLLNPELTVDEAVQIALLNNRNLQAVYEDLMIAQADLVAAGLLSNPVFDAEIRFFDEGTGAELGVAQNFLELLYLPVRKRVAEATFEATKLRVAGAVLDLAGEVRSAFFEHQGSQDLLEMRRQVLLATEASYETARQLRDAGNITELDFANERALYAQSKLNLAAAEARVTAPPLHLASSRFAKAQLSQTTNSLATVSLRNPAHESVRLQRERDGRVRCSAWSGIIRKPHESFFHTPANGGNPMARRRSSTWSASSIG